MHNFLMKMYKKNLHKYLFFRIIRNIYISFFFIINDRKSIPRRIIEIIQFSLFSKTRKLISFSEFCKKHNVKTTILSDGGSVQVLKPKFFGRTPDGRQDYSLEDVTELEGTLTVLSPKVEIVVLKKATVTDSSYFIMVGDEAIHPDFYIPETEVCFPEKHKKIKIDIENKTVTTFQKGRKKYKKAITIVSQCHGNYAHFMVETLPMLLASQDYKDFADCPIITAKWVHYNMLEAVSILTTPMREFVYLDFFESIEVQELLVVTPAAYVPAEDREVHKTGKIVKMESDYFKFSSFGINLVRNTILDLVKVDASEKQQQIYLSRRSTSNGRNLANAPEVDRITNRHGFKSVDLNNLGFVEQISTFMSADVIITPIGAGLINAMFTKKTCKIIILAPYYKDANFHYFNNFLRLIGRTTYHIIGAQTPHANGNHPSNADFFADTIALDKILRLLVTKQKVKSPSSFFSLKKPHTLSH